MPRKFESRTEEPGEAHRPCPGCGVNLAREAVLCVSCGYDFRLGKARTSTVKKAKPSRQEKFDRAAIEGFPRIETGLKLYSARILLSLLATLLIIGLTALATARHSTVNGGVLSVALFLGVGLWLLSVAIGLAGTASCLGVPAESRGRMPLILALFFDALTLPLGTIASLLQWPPLVSWITGVCAWVLFVAFLVRLAAYIDRPSEGREASTLVMNGLVLIALPFLLCIPLVLFLINGSGDVGMLFGLVIDVGLLAAGLLYFRLQFILLRLLEALRESLRQHAEQAKQREANARGRRLAADGPRRRRDRPSRWRWGVAVGSVAVAVLGCVLGVVALTWLAGRKPAGPSTATITLAENVDLTTLKTVNEGTRSATGRVFLVVRAPKPFGASTLRLEMKPHGSTNWIAAGDGAVDPKWDFAAIEKQFDTPGKFDVKVYTSMAELVAEATLEIVAPPAPESDISTKLSGVMEDSALADSGRLLVFKLKGKKELLVYDTSAKKLVKTLEMPSDEFTFAAGGDTLVVFLNDAKEIQSWSLKSFEQLNAKQFADPIHVLRIAMGHSRGDRAFIRLARGAQDSNPTTDHLLDVTTLTIMKPKGPRQQNPTMGLKFFRDKLLYRANADLSRISVWATSHNPSGIGLIACENDGFKVHYNHVSAGFLAMGDDGKVYTGSGRILDALTKQQAYGPELILRQQQAFPGQSLIPGIGAQFFLGVDFRGKLSIYQAGETTALCQLDDVPPNWVPEIRPAHWEIRHNNAPNELPAPGVPWQDTQNIVTLDKRIIFAPSLGYLLFIPKSRDLIVQREFDLRDALERTRKDYLLVLSKPPVRSRVGDQWRYQVVTLANNGPVKFELEKGPETMIVSDDGKLAWKIPNGTQGKAEVVVAITDRKGNIVRHRFEVVFE